MYSSLLHPCKKDILSDYIAPILTLQNTPCPILSPLVWFCRYIRMALPGETENEPLVVKLLRERAKQQEVFITQEQFDTRYHEIRSLIPRISKEPDALTQIEGKLKHLDKDIQCALLTATIQPMYYSSIPSLALDPFRGHPDALKALLKNLPVERYHEVLSQIVEADTPLTKALAFGNTRPLKDVFMYDPLPEEVFYALLQTSNYYGRKLFWLAEEKARSNPEFRPHWEEILNHWQVKTNNRAQCVFSFLRGDHETFKKHVTSLSEGAFYKLLLTKVDESCPFFQMADSMATSNPGFKKVWDEILRHWVLQSESRTDCMLDILRERSDAFDDTDRLSAFLTHDSLYEPGEGVIEALILLNGQDGLDLYSKLETRASISPTFKALWKDLNTCYERWDEAEALRKKTIEATSDTSHNTTQAPATGSDAAAMSKIGFHSHPKSPIDENNMTPPNNMLSAQC